MSRYICFTNLKHLIFSNGRSTICDIFRLPAFNGGTLCSHDFVDNPIVDQPSWLCQNQEMRCRSRRLELVQVHAVQVHAWHCYTPILNANGGTLCSQDFINIPIVNQPLWRWTDTDTPMLWRSMHGTVTHPYSMLIWSFFNYRGCIDTSKYMVTALFTKYMLLC
jgi:hypothetical protein